MSGSRPSPRLPDPGRESGSRVLPLRTILSLVLLLAGVVAVVAGAYICFGLGVALIVGGALAFVAEWLMP